MEQLRREEQEEQERRIQAEQVALINAERVEFRQALSKVKAEEKERAAALLQRLEEQRQERLELLRLQVAASIEEKVERDFDRASGHTESSKIATETTEDETKKDKSKLVHGYTHEQLMKDPRFKMMTQMHEKGLTQGRAFEYARQVVMSTHGATKTRPDNITSLQRHIHH